MAFEFSAIADFGLDRAAGVLTRAFADYFVKIPFSAASLMQSVRADSVDLSVSRVIVIDGVACGAALIARRGWTSRLAGMGIVPEARRMGAGRATMVQLLAEARARGDRAMVLEVIEQNEPAVRLYAAMGFAKVRRLVGFSGPGAAQAEVSSGLTEVDLRAMADVVTRNASGDWPWQLSGETLAQLTPPAVAFHLDGAWLALGNPSVTPVVIRGLVTAGSRCGRGQAVALLRAAMARLPGKEWRISALWPEELSDVFTAAGLTRTPLSQWQMEQRL